MYLFICLYVTLRNAEKTVCLKIYETEKVPNLYFSNQTQFDLKIITGI